MKKYILTALLGVFVLFGFTSATSYTFVGDDSYGGYSPSEISFSSDFLLSSIDFGDCNSDYCVFRIQDFDDSDIFCEISNQSESFWGEVSWCSLNSYIPAGNYWFSHSDGDSFETVTISNISSGGGNSGGGSLGDLNTSGGILSGGLTTLGSVLTSLSTAINEFIPYMVYMGLGILIATLGFIAIKRLVNYTSRKVTGIFSSKRRK